MLKDSDIFAVGEILVRIDEQLIGLPGTNIEDLRGLILSRNRPFDQCSGFFAAHPWIKPVTYQDTAKSVEYVAQCQDPSKAALWELAGGGILSPAYIKGTGAG